MVQGEKTNMLTATSCMARTMDPFARKAGYEAVQRMDKQNTFGLKQSSSSQKEGSSSAATPTSYGSWGPVFQNKQTFASMHFC